MTFSNSSLRDINSSSASGRIKVSYFLEIYFSKSFTLFRATFLSKPGHPVRRAIFFIIEYTYL
jgi:hypothetical protein